METKNNLIPLFGIKVKKRLVELNMTQRQLAKDIGINENYLTDILKGRRSGKKYKDAITRKLNIDCDEKQSIKMKEVI